MMRSHRRALLRVWVLAILLAGGVLGASWAPVDSQSTVVPSLAGRASTAGAIRLPDGYQMPTFARTERSAALSASGGVRAVAIVGDVGDNTAGFKADMERAVAALQTHGVTVTRFYYGDSSFTWADIVAAAEGAHILLYMGHGVYWGGTSTNPTSVGGFYLGDSQYVTPDAIRGDLANWLADDAVMIFSHACYAAGSTADDLDGTPGVTEAQRRVTLYAEPFVDLGMKAVYANNYFGSSEDYVNQLLADPSERDTFGEIFHATYPNLAANHNDLSYPATGYDLWLNGTEGAWDHAFVGQPAYTFGPDLRVPELGGLPGSVGFLYSIPDVTLAPISVTIVPLNVGTSDPLTWTVVSSGDWFTVTPTASTTPAGFRIVPDGLPYEEGSYTGAITVTVVAPANVLATPQHIALQLVVTDRPLSYVYLPLVARAAWQARSSVD